MKNVCLTREPGNREMGNQEMGNWEMGTRKIKKWEVKQARMLNADCVKCNLRERISRKMRKWKQESEADENA